LVELLHRRRWGRLDGLGALVLTPTRELAVQARAGLGACRLRAFWLLLVAICRLQACGLRLVWLPLLAAIAAVAAAAFAVAGQRPWLGFSLRLLKGSAALVLPCTHLALVHWLLLCRSPKAPGARP
jgi:hypothetical protein